MDHSESGSFDHHWTWFGKSIPKGEVVYFCQMIVLFIVIISCIVNLSVHNGNSEMWVSLFGYSLGAILPPPKIKRAIKGITHQPLTHHHHRHHDDDVEEERT